MTKKRFLLLNLILSLIILTIGCSNKDNMPINFTVENPIKELISSKDDSYDFLSDSAYLDNIDIFVNTIKAEHENSKINYAIGNLDKDNIPEIALFAGKDPENEEDKGNLNIYKFNGDKYTIVDKTPMNFDISNYQIEIGNVSKNEKGVFLNNNVGPNSGVTYGFILKDGKLKSILNDRKMNLVSIYTENQIKDINNDGILDFSIYTIDPETEDISVEGSDKMTIWYQWNRRDSGEILKIERKDFSKESSDKELYRQIKKIANNNFYDFINVLSENKDKLSNYDNTALLKEYIAKIQSNLHNKSFQIEKLFIKYQEGQNFNYLFDKYGITIDKFNNLEYLTREKVLQDESKIKEHIIKNINLGYKLNTQEGIYYYLIDYKRLLNLFQNNLTREYADYLQILSLNSEEAFLNDGSLVISSENLIDRILISESFKMIYPYSDLYDEVNQIYKNYLMVYLYGDIHNPNFDIKTGKVRQESLNELQSTVEKYPYTNFADILGNFIKWIQENSNIINDDIREKLDNRLN